MTFPPVSVRPALRPRAGQEVPDRGEILAQTPVGVRQDRIPVGLWQSREGTLRLGHGQGLAALSRGSQPDRGMPGTQPISQGCRKRGEETSSGGVVIAASRRAVGRSAARDGPKP